MRLAPILAAVSAKTELIPPCNTPKGCCTLSTNHLKSVTSGKLTVEATPLRIGKKIQVWQANTFDDKNNLTSNSTITLTNIN